MAGYSCCSARPVLEIVFSEGRGHGSGREVFAVSSSDLVSKWQGESLRDWSRICSAWRARRSTRSFLLMRSTRSMSRRSGESDTQAATERIKTEFLVQMQGVASAKDGLLVLGATIFPGTWTRPSEDVLKKESTSLARRGRARDDAEDPPGQHSEPADAAGLRSVGHAGRWHVRFGSLNRVCREAIMEPMRTCQKARQFRPVVVDHPGDAVAASTYPSCAYCPIDLSDAPGLQGPVPVLWGR